MLQDMRKSAQGTVAKIVVGFIIVIFALFGAESIVGSLGGEPEVALVNGEGILESNYARTLEGKRRQILAQMGERVDPDLIDEALLRSSVLEGMIQEEILKQDAEQKGLYVSSVSVDDYIRGIEQFKVDGKFSGERLQQILRGAGLTLNGYRDSLRSQFVLGQSRSALIASAFVLDGERNEIIELDQQKRTFGFATVFKRDYLDAVTVSDVEKEAYYQENTSLYRKPKNVDVSYVQIVRSELSVGIKISDEEAIVLYEREKSEFEGDEERQAAHILVKIDDEMSEEDALKKVMAIDARIKSGEEFSVLAIEMSDDEGSAKNGGDLGVSGRGVYVSDFETALFGLNEGEVTAPVKTEFGYHLIKLLAIETTKIPSFDEMKLSLVQRLQDERADQLYAEKTESLADLSYSSPDLAEPADELTLEIKQLIGVSVLTENKIFSNIKVQRMLFSEELVKDQNNSEIIEIAEGHSIVFRVNSFHEESALALKEVNAQVEDALKYEKTAAFAESVGKEFIARIVAGESAVSVSKDMGLNWQDYQDIKRNNVMVSRDVVTKAFALSKSEVLSENVLGFRSFDGDFSIVMLESIKAGEPELSTSLESSAISNMLSDSLGASDYRNYQDVMVRKAEVERI